MLSIILLALSLSEGARFLHQDHENPHFKVLVIYLIDLVSLLVLLQRYLFVMRDIVPIFSLIQNL